MKKLVSLTLTLVMILACLSGLALAEGTVPADAAKPIAIVTTGTTTVECKTVEEMVAAVDASGKSVVAIQQDFAWTNAVPIDFPYACTIDFGGHTVTTSEDTSIDGIRIMAAGTENNVTTFKNGTLVAGRIGIRIRSGAGGMNVKDLTVICKNECLSPDDATYAGDSYVEDGLFISKEWGPLAFNVGDDCSKHTIHVKDSTLVSLAGAGVVVFDIGNSGCVAGTIDLGTGVVMYTRSASFASGVVPVTGEEVTKAPERATYENTELGIKLDKLNKYTTAPSPEEPEVPQGGVADSDVPTTGISVVGLGILAAISAAGAAFTLRKKED